MGDLTRAAARTTALWFGLLTVVNVAGSLRRPAFDANLWWIDLRFLPALGGLVIAAPFYLVWARGGIAPRAPVPLSLFLALVLVWIAACVRATPPDAEPGGHRPEGFDVWTVPSRATPIPQNETLAMREIPAFWLYYLRATL